MNSQGWDPALTEGLRELAADSFPKRCTSCGRVFATAEEFLRETASFPEGSSGFKQSVDDHENVIVELFRNCPCGSTLMEFFDNRRDTSAAGDERRRLFRQLQDYLVEQGMELQAAREEILNVLHGRDSELLSYLRSSIKP